jgi:hypothetical protein
MEAAMTESEAEHIPRIDKVGYLYETLGWIDDGATFEEIREAQIGYRKGLDRDNFVDKRSGASSGRLLEKRTNAETYWANVRATIAELMRLGLVEPGSVPSRKEQLEAHRGRSYRLTGEGIQFIALMGQDFWAFQDRFAQAFVLAHPSLRRLLVQLASRDLFIPRLGTEDLRGHILSASEVPSFSALVEDVCTRISSAGGPEIAPERLLVEFEPRMLKLWKKRDVTLKSHDFNKFMVKAINDQLLAAMAALHRIPFNVIDFHSAVALMSGLCAIDGTHALERRTGWTIWSTSDAPPANACREGLSPAAESLAGPTWYSRRTLTETVLRDEIVEGALSIPSREGGFALIHEVRAHVCHQHRIHSRSFNELLGKMHSGAVTHPGYSIFLDRGGYAHLPPSEIPFLSGGRDFYIMTFMPTKEAHRGACQQVYS